ncbi:hypothetical protein JI735_22540 [Paenibacillus sonchi]|uniref:Cyclic nucleotide-binding domain-containing protein n=1 Tax=Paenibacillus sonchi TaxID=373687 RepID=A0A974P8R6_9BACL|nr:hypothetical protein [Paenibacillus sonchi]QQZ59415.1 hypothetical protein JI735_22540 [Paenibacillus sonchi]
MQWIADQDKIRTLAGHNGLMEIFSSGAISGMELRRYSDGEAICSVGDRLEHMFILVEGRLKIHTLLPEREIAAGPFCPADVGHWRCGAAAPISGQK